MGGIESNDEKKEVNQAFSNLSRLQSLPDSTRILLAEDNFINQRVITAMIKKTNIIVDVVADGEAAVLAMQNTPYKLVLMDVQMPKMDGLTATREIREKLKLDKIPIVAMTANAMKGDREHCLVAGMNDYLSKPIKPGELFSILEYWLLDHNQ